MRASLPSILLLVGVSGCILGTPTDHGDRFLKIVVEPEYPAGGTESITIRAVVINRTTDREFYSDVGDRLDERIDQPLIYASRLTQAVIERQTASGSWVIASQGRLIEGSRFVVLRTGKRYDLQGTIAPNAGRYRIRIAYSKRNEDRWPPFRDYSAAFVVR